MSEMDHIRDRYAKRNQQNYGDQYSMLNPSVYMSYQEKERALLRFLTLYVGQNIKSKKILEVGCGTGSNLLQLIRFGFLPENIVGNELLEERINLAKHILPSTITLEQGDACELSYEKESFDIVYQSTVFTSILAGDIKIKLAYKMWELTKPGGAILWYDFVYDNPGNKDVKGVKVSEIKKLFPQCVKCNIQRVTLAPPISRRVCKTHPSLYTLFNSLPFLRTHVLCWIEKPL